MLQWLLRMLIIGTVCINMHEQFQCRCGKCNGFIRIHVWWDVCFMHTDMHMCNHNTCNGHLYSFPQNSYSRHVHTSIYTYQFTMHAWMRTQTHTHTYVCTYTCLMHRYGYLHRHLHTHTPALKHLHGKHTWMFRWHINKYRESFA